MFGKYLKGLLTGTVVSAVILGAVSVMADLPPSMSMIDLIKIRATEVKETIQEYRQEAGNGSEDGSEGEAAPETPAATTSEEPTPSETESGENASQTEVPQNSGAALKVAAPETTQAMLKHEENQSVTRSITAEPIIQSMSELMKSTIPAEVSAVPEQPKAPESVSLSSGFGS